MKVFDASKIKDLEVVATLKIDGVRGIKNADGWLSRAGKPLYNLPDMPDGEYEIYLGHFKNSISACRTHDGLPISPMCLFELFPNIDPRLMIGRVYTSQLPELFNTALLDGYEGLVVHTTKGPFKIKQKLTFDCTVVAMQPGTGKHTGKMGALIIDLHGVTFKVGTGFTDIQRAEFNNPKIIGQIIEIEGMELTELGRVRHPRFIRIREDLG